MRNYNPKRYDFICQECKKKYVAKTIKSKFCSVNCRTNNFKKNKRHKEFMAKVEMIKKQILTRYKTGLQ